QDRRPALLLGPGRCEVAYPERDLARDVGDLPELDEALTGRLLDPHRRDACARVRGICHEPGALDDVVLEQAMDEDDVRAEQLLTARDALADHRAVVDDDLEVEVRDPDARVALALRGGGDV